MKRSLQLFMASVFFVLGFSVVFSLLGVLLQGVLSAVAGSVQIWLGRIGGVLIILFGIYLLGLIEVPFLQQEHKFRVGKFRSMYVTSFLFGAAFAVGWTPCVGAVLGAVLALAVTQPSMAFFLLLAYSLGLGVPFLIVGFFTNSAQRFIQKYASVLLVLQRVFGGVLVALGVLVFTNQLNRIANIAWLSNLLIGLNFGSVTIGASLNVSIAFLAGLFSFLSPCVLPLIPAFLAYLASVTVRAQ